VFHPPETCAIEMRAEQRRIGYVKEMRSEHVGFLTAEAPLLAAGHRVFVLHDADGCPLLVCGGHAEALADAASAQIETVSLH
jgi:hypothetical protein